MNRSQRRQVGADPQSLLKVILNQLSKDPTQLSLEVKRHLSPKQWAAIKSQVFQLQQQCSVSMILNSISLKEVSENDLNDRTSHPSSHNKSSSH